MNFIKKERKKDVKLKRIYFIKCYTYPVRDLITLLYLSRCYVNYC